QLHRRAPGATAGGRRRDHVLRRRRIHRRPRAAGAWRCGVEYRRRVADGGSDAEAGGGGEVSGSRRLGTGGRGKTCGTATRAATTGMLSPAPGQPPAPAARQRGFTLLEVIIAFAVLALALTLLLGTLSGSAREVRAS